MATESDRFNQEAICGARHDPVHTLGHKIDLARPRPSGAGLAPLGRGRGAN